MVALFFYPPGIMRLFAAFLISALALGTSTFAQEPTIAASNYVIKPGDTLEFRILGEPDMDMTLRVEQNGSIQLPMIGQVRVAGRTASEARSAIYRLYVPDYFVKPQIQLSVISFKIDTVEFLGEVRKPGPVGIPPDEPLTFLTALSQAGGFTQLANQRKVILRRRMDDGKVQTINLDAKDMLRDTEARDIPLQDGDIILVLETIL